MINLETNQMEVMIGDEKRHRLIDYLDTSCSPARCMPVLYEGERVVFMIGDDVPIIFKA